ncbi:MAG: hypothetical protein IAF38_11780 [Bacteroidia bacterium]|nr:hypothetical protein [Bacteroidia bacterium]
MESDSSFNPGPQFDENYKERHGCVTAFLIGSMILNAIIALVYLFASGVINDNLPDPIPQSCFYALAGFGILNIICNILMLQWKKIGFWGAVISCIAIFIVNVFSGLDILQSVMGLGGIGALAGVLQIRKGGKSAWNNLS